VPDTAVRETTARLRHVVTSPSKMRQVLDLIRGQDIETARDTLTFCERAAAGPVGKLLDSAVANAEHNDHIAAEELFVARAYADDGPTLKRWRPRARGRGVRIRKRTSHVTIVVARFGEEDLERRRRVEATQRPQRRVRRRPAAPPPDELEEGEEALELDDAELEAQALAAAEPAGGEEAEETPRPRAAKTAKQAAKTTKKAAGSGETTAKKSTAKKTTAKKTTAKKTTKKAGGATKKASPRKRAKPKDED
jgi:large subunit ribosomal protein L22